MNRQDEVNKAINDINICINLLAVTTDDAPRNGILNLLSCKVYDIYIINNLDIDSTEKHLSNVHSLNAQSERTFTKEELSKFNGKNGTPAYVAVNGLVYDVTNSAAWGAATHFGLSAGNDLTSQFASCHAGQPILQKLPQVGKMMNDRSESIE